MTDNVAITAGSGTTIAADDIGGGVLAQRVKPVWGPDGTGNDVDIATGKPFPVQLRGSDGTDRSNLLPVSVAAGAAAIAKAEDVASADADVGVPAMAVRKATPANTSGTDGDYEMLQISAGRLWTSLRTALTDTVTAKIATDAIMNDTTALTPKFAKIAASSSGANTLVAAVTSKKLRVLAYNMMANGAVNAKFQSHVTPTDLTGLKYMDGTGAGMSAPFSPVGWFETVAGEALDLNLSGAVAVGGELVYVEV